MNETHSKCLYFVSEFQQNVMNKEEVPCGAQPKL